MRLRLGSKKAGQCLRVGLLSILLISCGLVALKLESDRDSSTDTNSRRFVTFSQLRTQPEGLPFDLRRIIRHPPLGANWTLAQRLRIHVKGRFWAVPANDAICIIGQGKDSVIEMTCTTTKAALQHGVAIVSLDQPKVAGEPAARLTVGMAPDGSRTVVIHTGTRTTTGAIANGVFAVRDMATGPPDELTFR